MIEWISVKDRLPQNKSEVLCIDRDQNITVSYYERLEVSREPGFIDRWNSFYCCGNEPGDPTHWMPLPEPSK